MSDSNKETIQLLNKLKRNNQKVLMYKIYKLGFDVLSSYMSAETDEDLQDSFFIADREKERVAKSIDSSILVVNQVIKKHKEEGTSISDIEDVVKMQDDKLKEISIKKDYKNFLRLLDSYVEKDGARFHMGDDYDEDDNEGESYIEDFLE